jgi:hypothetical protein
MDTTCRENDKKKKLLENFDYAGGKKYTGRPRKRWTEAETGS